MTDLLTTIDNLAAKLRNKPHACWRDPDADIDFRTEIAREMRAAVRAEAIAAASKPKRPARPKRMSAHEAAEAVFGGKRKTARVVAGRKGRTVLVEVRA